MKKEIEEYIEEITTNFSTLFVETFFLRYLSDYPKDSLLESINNTKKILHNKLEKDIAIKLKDLGFTSKNIKINKKEE